MIHNPLIKSATGVESVALYINKVRLVRNLSFNHLTVEASDVADGFVLRAHSLAGASVGAVTEAEFVHLGNHVLHTAGSLYASLWEQGELRHLRRYEEH